MSLFRKRLADGERLDVGGVCVRLSVNRRARRISLRIDPASGQVIATAPSLGRLADAAAFAAARAAWITGRLAARPSPRAFRADETVTLFGAPCRLAADGRRPRLVAILGEESWSLIGCGHGEVDPQLVARAVKRQALEVFGARVGHHCRGLGTAKPAVSIGDAATRWGSCASARPGRAASIRLSWRLALAPAAVADYVVAHECAHLIEPNHGPRFWALVRGLIGDEKPHRAWLRAHGAGLHAFGRRS